MFDPFGDFAVVGYLQNSQHEKDLDIVKTVEHGLFRANLPKALEYLANRKQITYEDFLAVHKILFSSLYWWAGRDRAEILPDSAISKGSVLFCHPNMCRRAVEEGLIVARDKEAMKSRLGFIMGMFAFGHPFLDGNGRTLLLVHMELCYRAGFSIDWTCTKKQHYLSALTKEIEDPNSGHLDAYLKPFISKKVSRDQWKSEVAEMPGLDGANTEDTARGYEDPKVADEYAKFERKRGYTLQNHSSDSV